MSPQIEVITNVSPAALDQAFATGADRFSIETTWRPLIQRTCDLLSALPLERVDRNPADVDVRYRLIFSDGTHELLRLYAAIDGTLIYRDEVLEPPEGKRGWLRQLWQGLDSAERYVPPAPQE